MTTDNHDFFALGGDQPDDAALLTLFREWRAGMRDIEGPRLAEETEDQYDNQVDPSVCCCLQPSVSFARQRTSAAASARHPGTNSLPGLSGIGQDSEKAGRP